MEDVGTERWRVVVLITHLLLQVLKTPFEKCVLTKNRAACR